LNTVVGNAVEKSKLGEAGFVKHDIFNSPTLVEKVCSDDILSPLCDVPSYDDMFEEYALRNSCSLACDDTKPLVYDGYDDEYCRCSGYRGIAVHLLLGPVIGPSSAQGKNNDPSYGEDPHEEAPREENDGGNC
jgi:hypothetical protein